MRSSSETTTSLARNRRSITIAMLRGPSKSGSFNALVGYRPVFRRVLDCPATRCRAHALRGNARLTSCHPTTPSSSDKCRDRRRPGRSARRQLREWPGLPRIVNGGCHIHPPASEQVPYPHLGPHHHAGKSHEACTPDQRPILRFLAVSESAELRLGFAKAQVIQHGAEGVFAVFRARCDVPDKATSFARDCDVEDVIETGGDEHDSGDAVNDAAQVLAHAQHFSEPRVRELECEAS